MVVTGEGRLSESMRHLSRVPSLPWRQQAISSACFKATMYFKSPDRLLHRAGIIPQWTGEWCPREFDQEPRWWAHGEHLELRYLICWRIVSLYPQLLAEMLQHGVILTRDRFPSSKSTHLLLTYSGIGQVSVSIQLRRLPGPPFNGMYTRFWHRTSGNE